MVLWSAVGVHAGLYTLKLYKGQLIFEFQTSMYVVIRGLHLHYLDAYVWNASNMPSLFIFALAGQPGTKPSFSEGSRNSSPFSLSVPLQPSITTCSLPLRKRNKFNVLLILP